jgi:hypothetical protein
MDEAIKSDDLQEGMGNPAMPQRQFITDEKGHRIGVILPMDDYSTERLP